MLPSSVLVNLSVATSMRRNDGQTRADTHALPLLGEERHPYGKIVNPNEPKQGGHGGWAVREPPLRKPVPRSESANLPAIARICRHRVFVGMGDNPAQEKKHSRRLKEGR